MSLRIRIAAVGCLLALSLPATLRAEEEEIEDIAGDTYTQNVSISVASLLGGLAANYEYLVARRHGLLAEGGYALFGSGAGSWSAGGGYRFHFHPGMESLFAGAFFRYGGFDTEIPLEKETYDLSGSTLMVGANAGYRWQGATGVTFTLRGGYGIPVIKDVSWSPAEPEEAGLIEAFLGLDIELTLGYSF